VERFNQTVSNCLRAKVNENQDNWDESLPLILFSYRATMQSSTKFSPFYMMFARQPCFPIDAEFGEVEGLFISSCDDSEMHSAVEKLESINELVRSTAEKNIEKNTEKAKRTI
jgi:hypothetical protein